MNYSKIILIGRKNIKKSLLKETSIKIVPEDKIVPKKKINKFLLKKKNITTSRDGWYEQQFLKMGYSRICKKNYYLIWDVDTIPIKHFNLFENNHPFFDMRTQRLIPYFNTINRLIPGLNFSNHSYVTEHMMIKTELMKNLLDNIEKNNEIPGILFWEKILMAIDVQYIHGSGFSEYETYGSFVDTRYPNFYYHRNWYSKRDAKTVYDSSLNLNEDDINWLSQHYYALTFEIYQQFKEENLKFAKDKKIRNYYKPDEFFLNLKELLIKFNLTKKTKIYF